MTNYKYVIIGGGTSAGYAAQEFVKQAVPPGELCIVSAEKILPMNRPPLSKDYLKDADNDDGILINEKDFYELRGIDVKLETCARAVDFNAKTVDLHTGETLHYDKLLIATGSRLRRLDAPGNNLQNIFYLRNITHSDHIRQRATEVQTAVVIGGGYIGTETAASLTQHNVKVTMVLPEDHILAKFATSDIAGFFQQKFRERGIQFIFHDSAVAFEGDDRVQQVILKSGKRIAADMVVLGIGVEPSVKIFENTGLKINKAIVVNEFCETNIPDVYAAGDVTEFPDLIFEKSRHIEHWQNAFEQGRHVARVMMGIREPYFFLPYFFSDVFEYSYEFFGDAQTADVARNRGNLATGDFSTWWFDGYRLVAAFIMSTRPEAEGKKARDWIVQKTYIDKDKIDNAEIPIEIMELHTRTDQDSIV
jgi:NADPH-dependent 2,4-dienoyl-CoA reductase/sulfur reductase-like enzyme